MLPSPIQATRSPSTAPKRSRIVCRSARAWSGCASSVSALTTGIRGGSVEHLELCVERRSGSRSRRGSGRARVPCPRTAHRARAGAHRPGGRAPSRRDAPPRPRARRASVSSACGRAGRACALRAGGAARARAASPSARRRGRARPRSPRRSSRGRARASVRGGRRRAPGAARRSCVAVQVVPELLGELGAGHSVAGGEEDRVVAGDAARDLRQAGLVERERERVRVTGRRPDDDEVPFVASRPVAQRRSAEVSSLIRSRSAAPGSA